MSSEIHRSAIRAVNKIGLERHGFSKEQVASIQEAFRAIIRSGMTVDEAVASLRDSHPGVPEVEEMIAFATSSRAGLARQRKSAVEPG